MLLPWWVATIACSGPEADRADVVPSPDSGDTATVPFAAHCELMADNALRVGCSVVLAAPGPVRVEFERLGGPLRLFPSLDVETDHDVLAWGLRPSTVYTWRAVDEVGGDVVEGHLTTGPLPIEFELFHAWVQEPGPAQVEAVMIAPGCPGNTVLIVDREGFVVWYQEIDALVSTPGFVNAMNFTEDATVLVEVGKQTLLEFDLGGRILVRADRGEQFENYVHHELFKRGGLIYAIESTAETIDGVAWVIDGITVFDGSGSAIDTLSVRDFYPRSSELWMVGGYWFPQFPGAVDFNHTNSIFVDDAGDLWLSFRHLMAFAKVRGGPGTPGFGELLFTAVGDPLSPIAELSDLVLVGEEPTFAGQHDVHVANDGTILMFDNGLLSDQQARGVRYALDEEARTLTEVDSWELDTYCSTRGSVQELPGGDVLTTCAASGTIREYGPGAETWGWQLSATCQQLIPAQFSRGVPIAL